MKKSKNKLVFVGIFLLLVIVGSSYAYYQYSVGGTRSNLLKAGKLELILDENETTGISLADIMPTTDEKGKASDGYKFSLVNTGKIDSNYSIYLDDLDLEKNIIRMKDSFVKYSLLKNNVEIGSGYLSDIGENPNRILDTGSINKLDTINYTLKMWIGSDADSTVQKTVFYGRLRIELEQNNKKTEENSDMEVYSDIPAQIDLKGKNKDEVVITSSDLDVITVDDSGIINVLGPGYSTVLVKDKITNEKLEEIKVHANVLIIATALKENLTCYLKEKGQESCEIVLPNYDEESGYEFIGWNSDSSAHSGVKSGEKYQVSQGTVLYPIVRREGIEYKVTFVKNGPGINSIEKENLTCKTDYAYGNEDINEKSCEITLPEIIANNGYTVVGWNTNSSATTGIISGTKLVINKDTTFYTISKKNAKTLTATFKLNGAKSLDGKNTDIVKKCQVEESYNSKGNDSCTIIPPTIIGSENTNIVVGFSLNKDSTTSSVNNSEIMLTEDTTYYAITKSDIKTHTIIFYKNGAVSLNGDTDEMLEQRCNIPSTYNGVKQNDSCFITSPSIEADQNTKTIIGFSTNINNHESDWNAREQKEVNSNAIYYAQTKSDTITYNVNFEKGSHIKSISKTNDTCVINSTYNGVKQGSLCEIIGPEIVANEGYMSVGWGKREGLKDGVTTITLTQDNEIYYANAIANSYTVEYYSNNEKIGSSSVSLDKEIILKTAEELLMSKNGYTFKGWSTSSESLSVQYQDGATLSNVSVPVLKLYAVWQDDIGPICTFSSELSNVEVLNDLELSLTCTDMGVGIASGDLTTSSFVLSNENGIITSVSEKIEIDNGFRYKITTRGVSVGDYSISLTEGALQDLLGNSSLLATSTNISVLGRTLTATFVKNGDGVSSIGSNSLSCTTKNSDATCNINLPSITAKNGYSVIGWSLNSSLFNSNNKVGDTITLTEDATYYSIAYKESINFESVSIGSGDSSVISPYYYPTDLAAGGGIEFNSSTWANMHYDVSGLDPNKIYKFSARIKTENLTSSSSYGAVVGTSRYIVGFSNIVFSWSDSVLGTAEKDVSVFVVPDYLGNATLLVGNPYGGYGGTVQGKITYSNLKLEEATNDDITIYHSKNNKIKLVMKNDDYNKLDTLVSNKENASQSFVNKLEDVYNLYANFVGQNSKDHGLLYPYNGIEEVLIYTNTHNYGALAGYPIEFNWKVSDIIATFANTNKISWGEIHELGHTFDESLSTLDGYYKTNRNSERMWDFHSEFWANMKALYAIDKGVVSTQEDMFKKFENTYNTTLGKSTNKTFNNDAFSHLFVQTINNKGEIDWLAMQKTFKWFNDLDSISFLNNAAEKYVWYIKKYSDFQTSGYENIYNVLTRDSNVLDTINLNFAYKDATSINVSESSITLPKGSNKTIIATPDSSATKGSVTFKSKNDSIATVDDFGKVKAIKEGVTTIEVYSFFNPNVKKQVQIVVQ